jgi:dipeptidyl aminopeptidase/acylaminoacyl peptidase
VDVKDALMTLPVTNGPAQMVPLTDGHTGDIDPTLDPHTDRLVFSSARTGHRSLWIARADGGDPRPLTNDSAIDERPAFSPDGRDVAFVSNRSGRQGIWMMSASGGAPILLAETTVLDSLTWSRDRARVIFARPERDRTALAAVTVATRQVDAIPTPAGACCPAASPTDDVIAYLQPTSLPPQGPTGIPGSRLWLRFIDSAGRRLYPDLPDQPPGFPNGYLAWAPDGKRLAGAAIAASSASSLTIIEPESRSPYRKLIDLPVTGRPRGFTWTRDGNAIILGNRQAPSDIVLFDVQGLNPQTPSLGRTAGR